MKGITVDTESRVVATHYAIVYAPGRSRGRFAETCVVIVASEYEAIAQADAEKKLFAAKVIGPSRSSEGQCIFYLDDWL